VAAFGLSELVKIRKRTAVNVNLELARKYIRAIENGATGDELARFFTPDVTITEMPNRVAPHGSVSDFAKAIEAAQRGQELFKKQTYTITNILSVADSVALELEWVGVTAVQIQNLPPDSEMRDHAAVFLKFRNGRIAQQRHYDCFEPW
jgi:ketosteroid isomerase-like protein